MMGGSFLCVRSSASVGIADINISQGTVATQLRYGGIIVKFPRQRASERISCWSFCIRFRFILCCLCIFL